MKIAIYQIAIERDENRLAFQSLNHIISVSNGRVPAELYDCVFAGEVSAQTLEQARTLFTKGDYEKAKPVFKKYAKSQPSNGNYNYWYGVCCLKTGEAEEAVKPLEIAVKKRITGGQLYLGQAYNETYRFEDAVNCFEEYIADLSKRKKPTEEAEKLLELSLIHI